jgi:asparagine synthase (glutamine-hydrolysing)
MGRAPLIFEQSKRTRRMCGILGTTIPVSADQFSRALESISHRGPDDRGTFSTSSIRIGHQRLSIQDLSKNGHQPMSILDEKIWIVFNGEIYNHLELRSSMGNEFAYRGSSDTETILYGYLKYGRDIVGRLNGIFSFAICDFRTNNLFLARDPLGVKPLYYYEKDGFFAFSSEIKAIVELPTIDRTLRPSVFHDYIQLLWSPGEATPFLHIKKLEPGYSLTKELGTLDPYSLEKYYELPYHGKYDTRNEAELIDALDEKLNMAVKRQLLSDVPVGFFLSGGLDSSLIAAIGKKHLGGRLRGYTIETPGGNQEDGFVDDLPYAEAAAKYLDIDLVKVKGDSDIVRDFDEMIWHLDEPQADAAPLHVQSICRTARRNGDIVLLGGTAGDDLFSGYRRHHAIEMEKWIRFVPRGVGRAIDAVLKVLGSKSANVRRARKLIQGLGLGQMERLCGYYSWLSTESGRKLFAPKFQDLLIESEPLSKLQSSLNRISNEQNPLNQMLFIDTKFFLADHNLNYTDKMSMASGVEVRVPFLDLELVEFACTIPVSFKMRGRCSKYLLKQVAKRYLPDEIIFRPKTGFGAPLRRWLTEGKLDSQIKRITTNSNAEFQTIFSLDAVRKLISETKDGTHDGTYSIWALIAIESWLRQFSATTN